MTADASQHFAAIAHAGLKSAAVALSHLLEVEVVVENASETAESISELESKLAEPDAVLSCASMLVWVTTGRAIAGVGSKTGTGHYLRSRESAGRLMLAWTPQAAAELIAVALVLDEPPQPDFDAWSDIQRSTLAETANVVGCAFLNTVAESIEQGASGNLSLIPSPPFVEQQFAGSLMEAAVTEIESQEEVSVSDRIWSASSSFRLVGRSVATRLVMVWQPSVWQRLSSMVTT
jgi:chemotaxis protein CheY-P-specific phosphatase CheC